MIRRHGPRRPGAIVPLAAILLTGLLAFIALALDLGILMMARNQCQNAADAAAMAGARTLNGDVTANNNYSAASPAALAAAGNNEVFGTAVASSQVTVTVGDYYYDTASSSFKISPSSLGKVGDNWSLVQATVTSSQPTYFAKVFGMTTTNATATATAAHRPRDTAIIVDFSGSMRFESLLGSPNSGPRVISMNPSTVYPKFGHYSGNSSKLTYSADQTAWSGETIGAANDEVVTTDSNASVISGFYGDATAFGTSTPAFTSAPASYATTPGGDAPLTVTKNTTGGAYAKTVKDVTGGTTRDWRFELDGYSAYAAGGINAKASTKSDYTNAPFYGYTQGPGYWGKTFFTWPPDPRVPLTTNAFIGCSAGPFTAPQIQSMVKRFMTDFGFTGAQMGLSKFQFVYTNWANWTASTLKTYLTGTLGLLATDPKVLQLMRLCNRNGGPGMPTDGAPNPVPCDWRARFFTTVARAPLMDDSKLWSGGTMAVPSSTTYLINYAAILDWIKNSGTNPFPNQLRAGGVVYYTAIPTTIDTSNFPPTDPNQRFWKEYIDEVLGFQQTGGSATAPTYNDVSSRTGYGADISWGTVSTSGQPIGWPTSAAGYINYLDNPHRPLLRFWFGAITMVDYLGNYNNNRLWWPGTVAEAPTYQTKLGIQAALKDILLNHPNDNVSLTFFSSPKSSAGGSGYYNTTPGPLGRDDRHMINSLWFSPKSIATNAEISLYNSLGQNPGDIYTVPRANGGTCYAMPLMLAYNQFSSNPALVNYTANAPTGTAGGLGRNGASKLLVFETDGMVNTGASATLVGSSNGTGYYRVRIADINNLSAGGSEFPTGVNGVSFATGAAQSQAIATQICADLSAGGFSMTRKPVRINCIAFGSLFNATSNASNKTNALQNLATMEAISGVQPAGATTLAANKIITGPFATRIANLQTAFTSIMQDGVQVTLISSGAGKP